MKLGFASKARNLENLYDRIASGVVPRLTIFKRGAWESDPKSVLTSIAAGFPGSPVIIRSSSGAEDQEQFSFAGAFLSIANVTSSDEAALSVAISSVLNSYEQIDEQDEFFVQQQIRDVRLSGVMFTRENTTLAPYYVINYDTSSERTDAVTSGNGAGLKTYVRARCSPFPPGDAMLAKLITLAAELESIYQTNALDIEFAIGKDETVYLLQVRPLTGRKPPLSVSDADFERYLNKLYRKLEKVSGRHYDIFGSQALFSVMSDWNPAEMIGIKPRALAHSLYRELITDATWAHQRYRYGYRDLRGVPLMVTFLGNPYIDVRASFNSFTPGELGNELAAKLIDYYIDQLRKHPANHDKVEFNIVFSCYYLNLAERLRPLREAGFSELDLDRIKFSLLNLTNRVISPSQSPFEEDLKSLSLIQERFEALGNSTMTDLEKIYWLIEDCKRYGTLPFAGLARAAFIAVQFLNSFVDSGIITADEKSLFLGSLNTVARQLSQDHQLVSQDKLSRADFLKKYGHLRPGTYNILSPRYDEDFELFFQSGDVQGETTHAASQFTLSDAQLERLTRELDQNGLRITAPQLVDFMRRAIESREHSKFLFTRNVSEILRLLKNIGEKLSIPLDDISFSSISTIKDFYGELSHHDVPDVLQKDIALNKVSFAIAQLIQLPQIITSPDDVYDFWLGEVEPNFVTQNRVSAKTVLERDLASEPLAQKIVFICGADPGYDWLFSKGIAGLVTQYGGVNSHMAIRCAELGIPAVIGCGELNFNEWSKASTLEIDCAARLVQVVSRRKSATH